VNKDEIKRAKEGAAASTAPCSLPSAVAELVDLMFDEDTIIHSLQEVGVNLAEMPLGAVTAEVVCLSASRSATIRSQFCCLRCRCGCN
jgi:hypothetical protein